MKRPGGTLPAPGEAPRLGRGTWGADAKNRLAPRRGGTSLAPGEAPRQGRGTWGADAKNRFAPWKGATMQTRRVHVSCIVLTAAETPPLRLTPANSTRVLAAGRIVSSDHQANAGLRIQAVCMATGQAAGPRRPGCAIRSAPQGCPLRATAPDFAGTPRHPPHTIGRGIFFSCVLARGHPPYTIRGVTD